MTADPQGGNFFPYNPKVIWILIFGRCAVMFSSGILGTAYPLFVMRHGGNLAESAPIMSALAAGPLIGSFLGGAADVRGPRGIMWTCIALGAIQPIPVITLINLNHYPQPWLMVTTAALSGIAASGYATAERTLFVQYCPRDKLQSLLTIVQVRGQVLLVLAGAVSGVIFNFSQMLPWVLDLTAYLLAAAAMIAVSKTKLLFPVRSDHVSLVEMIGGFRHIVATPFIRFILLVSVCANFALEGGTTLIYIKFIGVQRADPAAIGYFGAVVMSSSLVSSLVAPRLMRYVSLRTLMLLTVTGLGLAFGAIAYFPSLLVATIALSIGVFPLPMMGIMIAYRQILETPNDLQGRVAGALSVASGIATLTGPLCAGVLLSITSGTIALIVSAGLVLMLIPAIVRANSIKREGRTRSPMPALG